MLRPPILRLTAARNIDAAVKAYLKAGVPRSQIRGGFSAVRRRLGGRPECEPRLVSERRGACSRAFSRRLGSMPESRQESSITRLATTILTPGYLTPRTIEKNSWGSTATLPGTMRPESERDALQPGQRDLSIPSTTPRRSLQRTAYIRKNKPGRRHTCGQ